MFIFFVDQLIHVYIYLTIQRSEFKFVNVCTILLYTVAV